MAVTSIVLAAGRGTRMGVSDRPKVCFPILGRPALVRALETYTRVGISRHVVVVGHLAEQVMRTVDAACCNAAFVLQPEPRGTGDAARIAAEFLEDLGVTGKILIVAGDKHVEPGLVRRLLAEAERADLALVTGPRSAVGEGGLVLSDRRGRPGRILELFDYEHHRLAWLARQAWERGEDPRPVLRGRLAETEGAGPKLRRLVASWLGQLGEGALEPDRVERVLEKGRALIRVGSSRYRPDEIDVERVPVNMSMYALAAPLLYRLVQTLRSDNVQGEFYLTDIVAACRRRDPRARIAPVPVQHPGEVMAFNNPQELLQIEARVTLREAEHAEVRRRAAARWAAPVRTWAEALMEPAPAWRAAVRRLYGRVPDLAPWRELVRRFGAAFGWDRLALLVRSPGRVNLMGRHIDHQGGPINVMAIDREVLLLASPRDDDVFRLVNVDRARFDDRSFALSQEIARLPWQDWLGTVESPRTLELVHSAAGDWANYAKAAALRLQSLFRERQLRGADVAVWGNIPTGAGLSSSSAMVVAFAELVIRLNGLHVRPAALVDYCGEGEWFVGTRGGAADHAAIKMSRRGRVSHIRFFPFRTVGEAPFFPGHRLVVVNSGVPAAKGAAARDVFNQRTACYHLGLAVLRLRRPAWRLQLTHLSDLDPAVIGGTWGEILRAVADVPARLTREEWERHWVGGLTTEEQARIARLLAAHHPPAGGYPVQAVLLFGLAEMRRATLAFRCLQEGRAAEFGARMNDSHDGDRVRAFSPGGRGRGRRYEALPDAASLRRLAALLDRGAGPAPEARLASLPGGYGCSVPEVDRIVDAARGQAGVCGAQIAGAGLGGCLMVLVAAEAAGELASALCRRGWDAALYESVAGAGAIPPPAGGGSDAILGGAARI